MRTTFVDTLCRLAKEDDRIWLLCGDLGYSVLEPFVEQFPDRYINVGIAEQNMIGVAAGIAMTGKTVFTYSIVNFATFRCLEQIRNDVCYHNLPVKVVAVGGGFCYGPQGYTHHGLEDVAVTRVLPNMTVMAPADPLEARAATERLAASGGPGYLRLGRANEPVLHQTPFVWPEGQPIVAKAGAETLVVSSGPILSEVLAAVSAPGSAGAEVWSLPQVKPFPHAAFAEAARRFRTIVTVEEAQAEGGVGSAVAESVASHGTGTRVVRLGVDGTILTHAFSQAKARAHYGIDGKSIEATLSALATGSAAS